MMMRSFPAARPEFTTSKTAVWWDINDCPVPDGYDARRVRPSIEGALKKLNYNGPVTITAYGDLEQTPEHVLRGLSSTGVVVQHTAKELRCSFMYSDLLEWREHNQPPATIMLISDQVRKVFSFALAREQQKNLGYNMVVAYTYRCIKYSLLYTTAEWLWGSLLTSDSEAPRHVLRKCIKTGESAMFRCRSCVFDTQSLEDFSKHLSAHKEMGIDHSTRPSVSPEYEQSKLKRMPSNHSAPPEYATSNTAVFWDMWDCPVPDGYDARLVRPSIEGALKNLGYNGSVTINAYCDIKQTPEHVLRQLSSTGISLQHCVKDKRCSLMHTDLLLWSKHNPSPATIMFISDQVEKTFYFIICRFQQRVQGYKLVLAYTSTCTQASPLVTSAEWFWGSLLIDSETPRQVLHKCSKTGESVTFRCRSCRIDGLSLEDLTEHLSGEKHAQMESCIINQCIRRRAEYKVENSRKRKRSRKAFRTDFRLGRYLRLPNGRSRRRALKE